MSDRRALVCVRGFGIDRLLDRAASLLAPHLAWTIVHVIDERPSGELERAFAALPGRRSPHADAPLDRIQQIDDRLQHDVQADVERWLATWGRQADLAFRRGIPEREILELAMELEVEIVVVGSRAETGPHRFSPVSRYVVDHAGCAVLVVAPERPA